MNIVVLTAGRRVVVRPDTTWEKDSEDLYVPDFVGRLSWSPVLFTRVAKPGRSIGLRFAGRYFQTYSYGVLLYPEDLIDGTQEGYACACCLDHTSFLPGEMFDKSASGAGFTLLRDGEEIFRCGEASVPAMEENIAEVSRFCYLRTGDLVATELRPREPLCTREGGQCRLEGISGDVRLCDFKIVF